MQATISDGKVAVKCVECAKEVRVKPAKDGERCPKGWKRFGGELYCADCKAKLYVLRAITVPIVGPVGEPEIDTWPNLREALKTSWGESTALHNWMMSELYVRDVKRDGTMTKLPPRPQTYLYPEARARFPGIPSQTVSAIDQAVKGKYGSVRWKILWTGEMALPNYRYPTPFLAHNQSWSVAINDDGQPIIGVRIAGRRWHLRLRNGHRYARQIAAIEKIADGSAIKGELAIYRKRSGEWGNDNGVHDRENGQRVKYDVMVKLVAWIPRTEPRQGGGGGTMFIRTANDKLAVAVDDAGERIWSLNFDHLRKWTAEHRKKLDRYSDDAKAENRPVPSFAAKRDAELRKHRARMDTAVKEAARQIANYAKRRRVAVVKLNDSERGFCTEFPYSIFFERLRVVLDEYKIELVMAASGSVTQET